MPRYESEASNEHFQQVLRRKVCRFLREVAYQIKIFCAVFAVLFAGAFSAARAQAVLPPETQQELEGTIAALDKQIFDAYNACDLEKFQSLLADNVEFYHDLGGLMVGNRAVTAAVKKNICGKVQRVLVAGTLEAHMM